MSGADLTGLGTALALAQMDGGDLMDFIGGPVAPAVMAFSDESGRILKDFANVARQLAQGHVVEKKVPRIFKPFVANRETLVERETKRIEGLKGTFENTTNWRFIDDDISETPMQILQNLAYPEPARKEL